jgi:HEAT repeats
MRLRDLARRLAGLLGSHARIPLPPPALPKPFRERSLTELLAAVEEGQATLDGVLPSRLRRFDAELRSRSPWSTSWIGVLSSLSPSLVATLAQRSSHREKAAILLATHSSGWVREAAVPLLATQATPLSIGMLVVRSSDWVNEVRTAARRSLLELVDHRDGPDALLPCLSLIEQLGTSDARCREFAQQLLARAATAKADSLHAALDSQDRRTQRSAARLLARRGLAPDALEKAFGQDDPVTFGLIAEASVDAVDLATVERLSHCKVVARVREAALRRLVKEQGAAASRHVDRALLDRSGSVRAVAQSYAKDRGVDLPQRYADILADQRPTRAHLEVAIRGLVEVGGTAHTQLIAALAAHSSSRVREAVCTGLEALDVEGATNTLFALVGDRSRRVARRAGDALVRSRLGPDALDRLWLAATDRSDDALLPAFIALDRWRQIVYSVRGLQSREPHAGVLGLALLDNAMATWNGSSMTPSTAIRDELSGALPAVLPKLDDQRSRLLEHSIRSFLRSA